MSRARSPLLDLLAEAGAEITDFKPPETPVESPRAHREGAPRLGDLVVDLALASREHVELCARSQQRMMAQRGRRWPLGELLVQKGLLKPEQLDALLEQQRALATGERSAVPPAGSRRDSLGQESPPVEQDEEAAPQRPPFRLRRTHLAVLAIIALAALGAMILLSGL